MRRNAVNCLLFVLCLLVSGGALPAQVAPVELEHLDGDRRLISDYVGHGRWTIINVWSPTCSACVRELPTLRKFQEKHPDIDLVGITIDFPSFGYGKRDVLESFLKSEPLAYPLFLADMEQASEVIGNRLVAIPLIAIINPEGEVLARWPGVIVIAEIEEFMQNFEAYETGDPLSFE